MNESIKKKFFDLGPKASAILLKDKLQSHERNVKIKISAQGLKELYNTCLKVAKDGNIIWILHPPKTGGTSINNFFKKNHLDFTYVEYAVHTPFSSKKDMDLQLNCRRLIKIIPLRCPVSHTKSMYSFSKKGGGGMWKVGDSSFSEWIREGSIDNFFIKWMGGDFDKAIETLSEFDAVLDTSNLDSGMSKVIDLLGEDINFNNNHVNKSDSGFEVSQEDIDYIKEVKAEDYKLIKRFGVSEKY